MKKLPATAADVFPVRSIRIHTNRRGEQNFFGIVT